MAIFYGTDTDCVSDLPLVDVQVTDPKQLIGQRLARRLVTPRGALGLIGDDPDAGLDVRQFLNAALSPRQISAIGQAVEAEALKDEQVASSSAAVTFAAGALTIALKVSSSVGPFQLTLSVSALNTSLIFGS